MWKEIVKTALIGTQRGKISESDKAILAEIGIKIDAEPAKILLQSAALLGQMQRVGKELPKRKGGLPTASPEEMLETYSDKAAYNLALMLSSEEFAPALPEFLRHLENANKVLPPEALPQVLNKCVVDSELWEAIKSAVGERGKWLALQHPEWKNLVTQPKFENWDIGTKAERLSLLQFLRKQNPQKAVELIESTWTEDSFQDRKYFLDTLHTNLSENDEDFLESCLNDRRKEVREVAAYLLSKIENSALNERLFQEALQLIEVKSRMFKKPKLIITIPEKFKKEWKRDGIQEKSHQFQFGQKANWLGQIIQKIPPQKWDEHFKTSSSETLDIFLRSDWSELLLQALVNATGEHGNSFFAEAILTFWIKKRNKNRFQNVSIQPLFKAVSKSLFNKMCLLELKQSKGYLDDSEDIIILLMAYGDKYTWEDSLAKAFYFNLTNWLSTESRSWHGWHYRTILKKMVFQIRPQLHKELIKELPMNSQVWSNWQKDFEAFFTILQFRKEMIENI
ncbi:MAG: DUF5691 domain-containing protein [Saprospiraceae bacterium]